MSLVFVLYWTCRHRRWQNLIIVAASAIFYGWIHPWFLLLLYSSAVLDFLVGLAIQRHPGRRNLLLAISLAGNLGKLFYFKYLDFFIESFASILEKLGLGADLHTLGIFLPVGISFYTFQTLSYTIDVYRGKITPTRDLVDYVAFISFFPQLVAGPVERATSLLPQMEQERVLDWSQVRSGFGLALWGAFKKVVVADTIAPFVDKIFVLNDPSGAMIWAATLGFAVQILADFSAYTDIARGTARMLGFRLTENFNHPYLATSPSDFWRRWHITFSSWIRDYLYIPLGGSRGSFAFVTRNTFIAMVLSGLWHGAAWTFALWGVYHAMLLTGYRLVTERLPHRLRGHPYGQWVSVPLMFAFTCVGWLIFRETHIGRLVRFITLDPLVGTRDQWITAAVMATMTLACALPLLLAMLTQRIVVPRLRHSALYLPAETTTWAVMAVVISVFFRIAGNDFIYFQF